ncbi:MAG: proton-translocating NADH-quinone oxidoreductase subunit M [Verrucomicrobia bacterium]|nr:MAG: proton-translocating NADH-quinone oxidoreductase subunit M [Verrucomicrobiota bacterium]
MMLLLIVFIPFLAAIGLVFVPRNYRFVMRLVALATTLLVALLAVTLFWRFNADEAGYQFVTTIPFLGAESLGIHCRLGVDGINIGLILMGAIVAFASACVSWEIKEREKEFYILLLVMSGGILGAFASLDLFFFYFFHELALVPTFIMIGVWGRGENRNYATFQITLYLSLGALIALIGLIALYLQLPADRRTFDIEAITRHFNDRPMSENAQQFIFPLLMFGFGILVSLWPFHTWAPLGYSSAPTATAMLHAGVLKKFGLYGLIRVALPLMPDGAKSWLHILALLCLGNILYCGLVAMRQKDLNLLLGNSSVAHMGFVFLGIASLSLVGVTGAVVVMIAHGLLAALAFALSGYLYQQAETLDMTRMGGLMQRLPFVGAAMVLAMLAGCGLPGFANFVGEVMVFFGAWKSDLADAQRLVIVTAWGGLIIGALYSLRAVRNILHGPVGGKCQSTTDANPWRKVPFVLLLGALIVFGSFPKLLTEKIKPSAAVIVNMANGGNRNAPNPSPPGATIARATTRRSAK